jgi:hypothetical protein
VPRLGWRKRALAWPLADRPRPGTAVGGALAAYAAVCVAIIATVTASRDGTA